MAKKIAKKQLGLGIKALLQDFDAAPPRERAEVAREIAAEPFRVPVEHIEPNPFQPRLHFDEDALRELAASIEALDVIQPLTVRRLGPDRYQLISGERRLRASKLAGLPDVPAYVRTADDQGMLEMAIVENVQRADLDPIETAVGYRRLLDEVGLTHEALSERLGKRRSTISNALRLLQLPPEVQEALRTKRITAGHGRALAGLDETPTQLSLLRRIEAEGLSVRQTEAEVKRLLSPDAKAAPPASTPLSPILSDIQRQLTSSYGTRVQVKRDARGRGTFAIHFGNDEEFNRILEQLHGGE